MRALRNSQLPLVVLGALSAAFASLVAQTARADEPVAASEPRLMSETAEVTSVVDAFDKDDPFDLHLMLGFDQMWKSANIRRETSLFQPGLTTGGFVSRNENVATYNQTVSTLNAGADIGLYKDLALVIRVPIILSDSRSLGDLNGSSANPQRLQDPSGNQIFSVPFKSPTRSGVDWFSLGLDYAIFNQQRDFTKPTWVVGVGGRFAIGPSMHACSDTAIAVGPGGGTTRKCPDPVNPTAADRDPGISRGMDAINAHTVFSRRFGYVEPYTGLDFLAEFPQNRGDFGAANDLKGSLVNHPPLLGSFTMGMEVIPYEQKEQFQRLIADFRVIGSYHSAGRDYSELFDALGTSQAPSLRNPNPGAYHASGSATGAPSVADPTAEKAYFSGITDQQAYGSVAARTSATWQAGEYVKFQAGVGLLFNQSHLVTAADACNPNFTSDASQAGPCVGAVQNGSQTINGIPNPNHRAVIDTPGRRFSVDDTTVVDLWVTGVVMF